MLVLKRHKSESVVVPTPHGPLRIVVSKVGDGAVSLGFLGPRAVRVWREEVWEEMPPERQQSECNPQQ